MTNQMSNYDNFDIDQISSKLAQIWHYVCFFRCEKFFILGSFDNTENTKRQLFGTPNIRLNKELRERKRRAKKTEKVKRKESKGKGERKGLRGKGERSKRRELKA